MRARGLKKRRCALVGRVPSRGVWWCEISGLGKCPPLTLALVLRRAQRLQWHCWRCIGVLGPERGPQKPVVLQALHEGIGIDNRTGDFAQYVGVRLHLAVKVAGEVGQVRSEEHTSELQS